MGQVALKVVGPAFTRQPNFRERFERESDIAVTLDETITVASRSRGRNPARSPPGPFRAP
ncbi:MAG: hypothetical protein ACRDTF_04580 [Pseudonocardiaceae bacterium]